MLHLPPHKPEPLGTVQCSFMMSEGVGARKYVSKQLFLIYFLSKV